MHNSYTEDTYNKLLLTEFTYVSFCIVAVFVIVDLRTYKY